MSQRRSAYPYDYSRVEAVVADYLPVWRSLHFDAVVAIARGGLAPGLMASVGLSLPLHALLYSRPDRKVSWYTANTPRRPSRLLLVEDIAGRGTTLSDSLAFLRGQGHEVQVFALAYDADSRIKPDFGQEIQTDMRAWFPWEQTSITAAFERTENQPDQPEHEYASWAIDLDGVLLMDLPEHLYAQALHDTLAQRDLLTPSDTLPELDLTDITIITGRPEQDRERTQAWLSRHGFHGPLVMRNESLYSAEQTATHKAQAILARCHTHFLESDAAQALEIANQTRVARVIWWNGRQALLVHAGAVQDLRLV
ncbi:phosphoribosyltransferase [Pusillimonas sp. MFBS29]|uniref:phosphoribosyltransferase n=1 Tax=Pusillimonas sp. MFBS29 TaxID=2886690 RepID=UPI001D10CE8D|nr:phosphoribosyltransferase [Pusillimonas sp. MFBS29]MCC2596521.1 phosphoribosyltransferase [Pusillimonas sp. MFBS29]